jgi:hypothetical protein
MKGQKLVFLTDELYRLIEKEPFGLKEVRLYFYLTHDHPHFQTISSEVRHLVTLSADQVRSTRSTPFTEANNTPGSATFGIFPPDLPVSLITSGELGCQFKECRDNEDESKKAWTELQRDLAYNLSLVNEWIVASNSSHILWRDEEGAAIVKEAVVRMLNTTCSQ